MPLLKPTSVQDLQSIVVDATATLSPLEIIGNGTKRQLGCPIHSTQIISMSEYSGINFYAPDEMVIRVKAGTPIAEVHKVLADHGQHLTFEPPALYEGEQTIGGIIGCNLSGSRRISHGAARDSVIGVEFINGKGEQIKSGGRVMKNVTGYDFSKLLTGSYGTLGIMTDITLKVLPKPRDEITLIYTGLSDAQAIALQCVALGSPFEVTGAAHIIGGSGVAHYGVNEFASEVLSHLFQFTYIRLEGMSEFITPRANQLQNKLSIYGKAICIKGQDSNNIWRDINALRHYDTFPILWQISVAPTKAPHVVEQLNATIKAQFVHSYDWGGGRIWLAMNDINELEAQYLREIVGAAAGHATLMKAPSEIREIITPFHPQDAVVAAISNQIKLAFDPHHIFNPHKMGA